MKNKKIFNRNNSSIMRAKLSFDEGFAERPIYTIKGFVTEKEKGVNMIELIRDNFGICDEDMRKVIRERLEEYNKNFFTPIEKMRKSVAKPVEWKRDERGNII